MAQVPMEGGAPVDMRHVGYNTEAKTYTDSPLAYRLARRTSGELVLQGRFDWWSHGLHGETFTGEEWRDLPTVDIEG